MTPVLLAILASSLAANPLPDNKTPIDSLTYTFGGGALAFGPTGSLSIARDGKVKYFYSSAPHTGSGGRVVQQSWELSKEERTTLFRKLVDDGLLDAEEGRAFFESIRVTHGRWWMTLAPDKVPEKAMAHLRPLLAKADPGLWGEKKPAEKPGVPAYVIYHFCPKVNSDRITLAVMRDGKVRYTRQSQSGDAEPVKEEWTIPAKEAEALLDALAADGLFDLADTGGGQFPNHMIEGQVGRWRTNFHPKELPEKFLKPLLPLLKKADAAFWK